jgi:carbohydrate-selective porin OprB
MDRPFDRPRDDLGAGMKAIRMLQKRGKQQRLILHQSLHGTLFCMFS